MKVGFMGRGKTGLRILQSILDCGFDVPFIWTCKHTPEVGVSPEAFESIARSHEIPYAYVENINQDEWVKRLASHDIDTLVAIFWMDKVGKRVLDLPDHGVLNLHGGALPRYRGNAAANWAILEDETELGITVHKMVPEIDAGPILSQETVPITEETTVEDLIKATREVGTALILDTLNDFRQNIPVYPKSQDESKAMRCYPRLPEYGRIDWTESVTRIDRHIRSLGGPYPDAYTYHGHDRVSIHEASVLEPCPDHLAEPGHIVRSEAEGDIWVGTGNGILVVSRISINDGKSISPGEEFQSIRDRFGMNLQKQVCELSERVAEIEDRLNEK